MLEWSVNYLPASVVGLDLFVKSGISFRYTDLRHLLWHNLSRILNLESEFLHSISRFILFKDEFI